MKLQEALVLTTLCLVTPVLHGDVTVFEDFDNWSTSIGEHRTIGFTEYADGTFIDDEYSNLGVQFGGDGNIIRCCSDITFPQDGAGLDGNTLIRLTFDAPISGVAVDFPGILKMDLYADGTLLFESDNLGGGGPGHFAGLISTIPFDEVLIYDDVDLQVGLDDLHFGPPIPGAPAFALIAMVGLSPKRRRRR